MSAVLDLFYPRRCPFCRAAEPPAAAPLCVDCQRALAVDAQIRCQRCGSVMPDLASSRDSAAAGCGDCRDGKLAFSAAVIGGSYEGPLRDAVLRMKQPTGMSLAAAVAEQFYQGRATALRQLAPDLVAPIPMHWLRRWERGVNSPDVIAQTIAERMRLPCWPRLLRRRRATEKQGGLSRRQRRLNLHKALAVRWGYRVAGARVLLVDDILTTGATCHQAARALLRDGAAWVGVAVVARAAHAHHD